MSRYCGPRLRIIKRVGTFLPGLTRKVPFPEDTRNVLSFKTPGQHGKKRTRFPRKNLAGDFQERLIEKQKVRFNYGLSEKQMIRYIREAKRRFGSTELNLVKLLESRLDCIVFRLGFAKTIPSARQMVNHGHILVNQKKVTIPSLECCVNDIISIKTTEQQKEIIKNNLNLKKEQIKVVKKNFDSLSTQKHKSVDIRQYQKYFNLKTNYLKVDKKNLQGTILNLPELSQASIQFNQLKVIEYYSR